MSNSNYQAHIRYSHQLQRCFQNHLKSSSPAVSKSNGQSKPTSSSLKSGITSFSPFNPFNPLVVSFVTSQDFSWIKPLVSKNFPSVDDSARISSRSWHGSPNRGSGSSATGLDCVLAKSISPKRSSNVARWSTCSRDVSSERIPVAPEDNLSVWLSHAPLSETDLVLSAEELCLARLAQKVGHRQKGIVR